MLRQRLITALIALPIVLLPFLLEQMWLLIPFFCGCVALATYEIGSMLLPRLDAILRSGRVNSGRDDGHAEWLIGVGVILACIIFLGAASDPQQAGRGVIIAGFLATILLGCFLAPNNEQSLGRAMGLLMMVAYGTLPWLAVWELYLLGNHSGYVFLLMAVVWGGDTGAYFGGKRFGRIKLAPRMSPNKTVEGSVAGILASLALGLLINVLWGGSLGSWETITFASLFGGIFGQMGDLAESTFKRFALVKDSGSLFPGHGGFMDRVDGLLFAAPVIWAILYLMRA